jgi:uncharacterized protein (DUF1015 family)
MAEIQPFKGLRYNTQKVKLEDIITEPYDRITPAMQEDYYQRSSYNVVRIILGKEDEPGHPEKDKYKRAKIYLDEWEKKGILIREDKKALYLYEQEFAIKGEVKKRLGLIGRVKLEEFSSKKVLPHERTFSKHKEDRLRLLKATKNNTEQIFLLYTDDDKRVQRAIDEALKKAELGAEVRDEDKFLHRLWVVKDKKDIRNIQKAMADKILIIADGHHRYETSLNYRREITAETKKVKGDEPFQYVMMTLFDLNDPGLVILPTYRLVKNFEKLNEANFKNLYAQNFEISEVPWAGLSDKTTLNSILNQVNKEGHTFAAYLGQAKKFFTFHLKDESILDKEIKEEKPQAWKKLNVAILHLLLIDKLQALSDQPFSLENNVSYIRNLEEGLELVKKGEFQLIFLLKPASLQEIREIVESGELMPHKSTDFFPKLKSGLVMNPLDE